MKAYADRRLVMVGTIVALSVCPLGWTSSAIAKPLPLQNSAQDRGEAALAEARAAEDAGRWSEAADRYSEALNFTPGNAEAQAGQQRMLTMLNSASTSQDVAQMREVQRERAIAEFAEDKKLAEDRLKEGDFAGAEQAMLTGRIRLDQRRDFLSPAEFEERQREADETLNRISEARIKAAAAAQIERQRELEKQQADEQERQAKARQRQIDESLRRVRQLQMELKYREALQVIDEILFIDELNPAALALREAIRSTMLYREWSGIIVQKEYGIAEMSVDAQRSTIAPSRNISGPGPRSLSGVMAYPEDWPTTSIRRSGDVGGYLESPADRQVRQQLTDTKIPIDFNANTFEQVVEYLKQVTGLKFYVDWKALNIDGVDGHLGAEVEVDDGLVVGAVGSHGGLRRGRAPCAWLQAAASGVTEV
jgi:hypothetical protein